jgi:2'-5' RNA ligase
MENDKVKRQYYIALVPEPPLRETVDAMKKEIKHRFGAGHALKSPAHITLQMPFHRLESDEQGMFRCLQEFASREVRFNVSLEGFDCFPPRVLFVKVVDHLPLQEIQSRLHKTLISRLGFPERKIPQQFHPHMTLATRDLSESDFKIAWEDFRSRNFRASFCVKSLFLLKHNGKSWDLYREFPFRSSPGT